MRRDHGDCFARVLLCSCVCVRIMSDDGVMKKAFMTGLMKAHQWRYILKVGDTIDACQHTPATATAAAAVVAVPMLTEISSSWKEARVLGVDRERVEVSGRQQKRYKLFASQMRCAESAFRIESRVPMCMTRPNRVMRFFPENPAL